MLGQVRRLSEGSKSNPSKCFMVTNEGVELSPQRQRMLCARRVSLLSINLSLTYVLLRHTGCKWGFSKCLCKHQLYVLLSLFKAVNTGGMRSVAHSSSPLATCRLCVCSLLAASAAFATFVIDI